MDCLWWNLNVDLQDVVKEPGEVSVDDPVDILRSAELLEGVSVDCPTIQSDTEFKGDDLGHFQTIIIWYIPSEIWSKLFDQFLIHLYLII